LDKILTKSLARLLTATFTSAVLRFKPPEIGHSDGGSEYRSYNYQQIIADLSVKQSMSKKSSPWENGCKESFYSYFKLEIGSVNQFLTFQELEQEIKNYIEFYNKERICGVIKIAPSLIRSLTINSDPYLATLIDDFSKEISSFHLSTKY